MSDAQICGLCDLPRELHGGGVVESCPPGAQHAKQQKIGYDRAMAEITSNPPRPVSKPPVLSERSDEAKQAYHDGYVAALNWAENKVGNAGHIALATSMESYRMAVVELWEGMKG